jgi:hypothetical protein
MGKRAISKCFPAGHTRPASSSASFKTLGSATMLQLLNEVIAPTKDGDKCALAAFSQVHFAENLRRNWFRIFEDVDKANHHTVNIQWEDSQFVSEIRPLDDYSNVLCRINIPKNGSFFKLKVFRDSHTFTIEQYPVSQGVRQGIRQDVRFSQLISR